MTHLTRAASLAHPLAVGPKICQLVVGSSRALFGKKVAHPNFSGHPRICTNPSSGAGNRWGKGGLGACGLVSQWSNSAGPLTHYPKSEPAS